MRLDLDRQLGDELVRCLGRFVLAPHRFDRIKQLAGSGTDPLSDFRVQDLFEFRVALKKDPIGSVSPGVADAASEVSVGLRRGEAGPQVS
jgi:hypothetical protein